MAKIILSNGLHFECTPGISLLESAMCANVGIPYSCRTGRCSACKCKVIGGISTVLKAETGLTDQEKANGWILSCVRSAETDMHLEAADLGSVSLPPVKTLPCRIVSVEKLTQDVVKVVLRLPPNNNFTFLPGQYIDVIGPGGIRRSYSLATVSSAEKSLELHIRVVTGGVMSSFWFNQAKINDLLRINGPLGTFILRDVAGLELVFLATGTGMAPIKAMLEEIVTLPSECQPRSVTIYWGGRVASDLYWDVHSLSGSHRYVPVLSRAGEEWTGARGYVQQILIAEKSDFSETIVYACGSDAMVHAAKDALLNLGLPENRFLAEAFVCSAAN